MELVKANTQVSILEVDLTKMKTENERATLVLMQGAKAWQTDIDRYVELIAQLHVITGRVKENAQETAKEYYTQAVLLQEECNKYFRDLGFEELKIALHNALRCIQTPMYGLNIVEYTKAIKRYLNDEKRELDRRLVLERLNQVQLPEATDEQKDAISKAGFERLKAKVSAGESIVDDPGTLGCYNWLKKAGRLDGIMTEAEKEIISSKAKELLQAEYSKRATTFNKSSAVKFNDMLQKLNADLLPNELISTCKKLALEYLIKNNRL